MFPLYNFFSFLLQCFVGDKNHDIYSTCVHFFPLRTCPIANTLCLLKKARIHINNASRKRKYYQKAFLCIFSLTTMIYAILSSLIVHEIKQFFGEKITLSKGWGDIRFRLKYRPLPAAESTLFAFYFTKFSFHLKYRISRTYSCTEQI